MNESLLGYLLSALEPDELEQVERLIRSSNETHQRAELLRCSLEPLAGEEGTPVPPELAVRTCRLVREVRLVTKKAE